MSYKVSNIFLLSIYQLIQPKCISLTIEKKITEIHLRKLLRLLTEMTEIIQTRVFSCTSKSASIIRIIHINSTGSNSILHSRKFKFLTQCFVWTLKHQQANQIWSLINACYQSLCMFNRFWYASVTETIATQTAQVMICWFEALVIFWWGRITLRHMVVNIHALFLPFLLLLWLGNFSYKTCYFCQF